MCININLTLKSKKVSNIYHNSFNQGWFLTVIHQVGGLGSNIIIFSELNKEFTGPGVMAQGFI